MVDGEGEPADITLGGLGVPGGVQIPAVIHAQVAINPPGRYRDRPSTRADLGQRGRWADLSVPDLRLHNGSVSLVGVDVGSSAVKAAAYQLDGSPLADAVQAVPPAHPVPGAWEVDGDAVWAAVVDVVRRLTSESAVQHDPPAAVAVSASGRESYPARADGSALGPCLRTADDRRPRKDVAASLQRPPEQWIKDCGHVPDHMDPTSRLLWWTEQDP